MRSAQRRSGVRIIGDRRAFLNRVQRWRSRGRLTITNVGYDIAYAIAAYGIGAFLNVLEKPNGACGRKWPMASSSQAQLMNSGF